MYILSSIPYLNQYC